MKEMTKSEREYHDLAKYAAGILHDLLANSKGKVGPNWDTANASYYTIMERLKAADEARSGK